MKYDFQAGRGTCASALWLCLWVLVFWCPVRCWASTTCYFRPLFYGLRLFSTLCCSAFTALSCFWEWWPSLFFQGDSLFVFQHIYPIVLKRHIHGIDYRYMKLRIYRNNFCNIILKVLGNWLAYLNARYFKFFLKY